MHNVVVPLIDNPLLFNHSTVVHMCWYTMMSKAKPKWMISTQKGLTDLKSLSLGCLFTLCVLFELHILDPNFENTGLLVVVFF